MRRQPSRPPPRPGISGLVRDVETAGPACPRCGRPHAVHVTSRVHRCWCCEYVFRSPDLETEAEWPAFCRELAEGDADDADDDDDDDDADDDDDERPTDPHPPVPSPPPPAPPTPAPVEPQSDDDEGQTRITWGPQV